MAKKNKLKKELGLLDVFGISVGTMISSGFFLLPGIASGHVGPSIFLAYLLAGLLIMPSMFSIAEIATALPRAGGAYYFLDRGLGPLMGTIGGLGVYFALMFKTSFAIIGIGVYAAVFWDVPVKFIAISGALIFMILNLLGAKKTSTFQNFFVLLLLLILGVFIFNGLFDFLFADEVEKTEIKSRFTPFLTNGFEGMIYTSAFVFVSYLGLTQISSVAEEIKNPERNIPLGMLLSLVVTGLIYVLGVLVMVAFINTEDFLVDKAPAVTAAQKLFSWMPGNTGAYLMTGAALAAFVTTGIAGLLSASRYPLAMGRDKLLPLSFAKVGKKGTPSIAIIVTTAVIIAFILVLSKEDIVKLASSFQLIVFILINFSVIVFRKSAIDSYDPGYKSPFYPYMQIVGIIVSFILIIYMGWMTVLFCTMIILFGYFWFQYRKREKSERGGAIFHWFALLGKKRYAELENEFMHIIKEKGLRQGDPFDETIIKSQIIYINKDTVFEELIDIVAQNFYNQTNISKEALIEEFLSTSAIDPMLISPEVSIMYGKHQGIDQPLLQIFISQNPIKKQIKSGNIETEDNIKIFFFLINPSHEPRQQLRMLSRIIDIVERENFCDEILKLKSEREIKEYLIHNERFITVLLSPDNPQEELIGKQLKDIKMPPNVLIALDERGLETFTPNGLTTLLENDILTILGDPKSISQLFNKYISGKLKF